MSAKATCTGCGFEGYDADVKMRLVDLIDEEGYTEATLPRQIVELPATQINKPPDKVEAAQRYVREPRCRDKVACKARIADYERSVKAAELEANQPAPDPVMPPPSAVEEAAWTI